MPDDGELPLSVQVYDLHSTRTGGSSLPRSNTSFFLTLNPTGTANPRLSLMPALSKENVLGILEIAACLGIAGCANALKFIGKGHFYLGP
jgi:hypothetical protein